MGKDKLKTTALCVIALKTHPNRFRSGNRLTVSVWEQDQEFTFFIHDRVLSLEISEKKLLAKLHGSFLNSFHTSSCFKFCLNIISYFKRKDIIMYEKSKPLILLPN